jgi:hypothetical protein
MLMDVTARDTINVIKQKYELQLAYQESVLGPEHDQTWLGMWFLYGTGEVGRATARTKAGAKEESARIAVLWLVRWLGVSCEYYLCTKERTSNRGLTILYINRMPY